MLKRLLLMCFLMKADGRVKVKKEVKELCIALRQAHFDKQKLKFEQIADKLQKEYKFTAWQLLGLFENPPVIEYSDNNFSLVME